MDAVKQVLKGLQNNLDHRYNKAPRSAKKGRARKAKPRKKARKKVCSERKEPNFGYQN